MRSGPETSAVGFVGADGIFYRWAGVALPFGEAKGLNPLLRPTPTTEPEIVDIDPFVDYIPIGDGLAAPGYYDHSIAIFYRWNDVTFDPTTVPAEWLGRERVFDEQTGNGPRTFKCIPIPPHRRQFAEELRKAQASKRDR